MKKTEHYTIDQVGNLYFIHNAHPADFVRADEMLTTNETGAFLWEHIRDDIDAQGLAEALADYYEIDFTPALQDTKEFLTQLNNIGAIK